MKKYILIICSIVLFFSTCKNSSVTKENGYFPENGLVSDEKTAIKIAEAIWLPLFGEDILKQKPYVVKLENGIWYIKGTIQSSNNRKVVGGVAYIEISKYDCRILNVYHTK